jgi:hypothetical protein
MTHRDLEAASLCGPRLPVSASGGHERRRLSLKTMSSPINPDSDDRTGDREIVRRRSITLMTLLRESYLAPDLIYD